MAPMNLFIISKLISCQYGACKKKKSTEKICLNWIVFGDPPKCPETKLITFSDGPEPSYMYNRYKKNVQQNYSNFWSVRLKIEREITAT